MELKDPKKKKEKKLNTKIKYFGQKLLILLSL